MANSPQILRTEVAVILFLSKPGQDEGGERCIETRQGAWQIKLQGGDVSLYPASSLHRVNPVTKGSRVAAFLWPQSLIRDNKQRIMLFDCDPSI
jgi:PKHD-type hydroxylase